MAKNKKHVKILSWPKALLKVIILFIICALLGLLLLFKIIKDVPSLDELQNFDPQLITRIYSSDGVILKEFFLQRRTLVPLEKISPALLDAVISIEDTRFRSHWGLSLRDFLRAIYIDIITLSTRQGASTLTQQLARNLYIYKIGFERTVLRKLKELITAIQLERMYTKDEIAEMYLNSIYLGHGSYGVQAAAKRYLNKTTDNLTVDECALLAAIIKSPGRYTPLRHPVKAFQRRNLVLYRMKETGHLSEEEYALYKNTPLLVGSPEAHAKIAPYFVENVRRKLQKIDEKLGVDLYKDGLSIYTTLDTRIQACADSSFDMHIVHQQQVLDDRLLRNPDELQKIIESADTSVTLEQVQSMIRGEIPMKESLTDWLVIQGGLIAIEPGTGKIKAMIGGRHYEESEFNRATQAVRQPGSVFKPIVYSTAIDNGFSISTQLFNQPVVLHEADGTRWAPKNYDGSTGGLTTLREGIRRSLNLIAARILQELISPKSAVKTAKRMHISTRIPAVDAIALGAVGVKPIEIAGAYGVFANNGIWVEPISITRIEDRFGNVIAKYTPRQDMVFSEETAYLTTSLLQTVIDKGTGGSARWKYNFRHTAAGKTGTTNKWTDAWFSGFTPYLVATVYVGVDEPAVSLGRHESGSRAALPIWARFMREAHKVMNWEDKKFEKPEGVVEVQICKETKKLPSKYCPIETELYNKNNVPVEHCHIHDVIQEQNKSSNKVVF